MKSSARCFRLWLCALALTLCNTFAPRRRCARTADRVRCGQPQGVAGPGSHCLPTSRRPASARVVCGQFRLGPTDRTRRARRRVLFRRSGVDGLPAEKNADRRGQPPQPARQHTGAGGAGDRRHHAHRVAARRRSAAAPGRRPAFPGLDRQRARRQIRQGRVRFAGHMAGAAAARGRGGKRARRADAGGAREKRRWAWSTAAMRAPSPRCAWLRISRPVRIRPSFIRWRDWPPAGIRAPRRSWRGCALRRRKRSSARAASVRSEPVLHAHPACRCSRPKN